MNFLSLLFLYKVQQQGHFGSFPVHKEEFPKTIFKQTELLEDKVLARSIFYIHLVLYPGSFFINHESNI